MNSSNLALELPKNQAAQRFFSFFQDIKARRFLKENLIYSIKEGVLLNHPAALSREEIMRKAETIVSFIFHKIESLQNGHETELFECLERLSIHSETYPTLWFQEAKEAFAIYGQNNKNRKTCELLSPHFIGDSLLDIGCCRGSFLNYLAEVCEMKLAGSDIANYLQGENQFDFFLSDMSHKDERIEREFDCGLLIYVLHHIALGSGGVQNLLENARSMGIKRLLVLEDVMITPQDQRSGIPGMERLSDLILMQPQLERYISLPLDSQYAFTSMMDIFSNCLFQGNSTIPYPFNFGTISHWHHLFEEAGWKVKEVRLLGFSKWKFSKVCGALFVLDISELD